MKGELSCSEEESSTLLDEFLGILKRDPLIDELGFIHPSQILSLNIDSDDHAKADVLINKNHIFWSRDHKLGISTQYLFPLYNEGKLKFMSLCAKYKASGDSSPKETGTGIEQFSRSFDVSETESQLLSLSKAVLLLSSDFGTAWNMRKHIISKKLHTATLMDELLLSNLVLSYAPKTENAWSHRRWVIKIMARTDADLQEIVEKESELVEKIAETSKMNYRAWNHRIWLVSYMSRQQGHMVCFNHDTALYNIWKEELDWNETLIRRYIGREALWLHRRYLSVCWASTHDKYGAFMDNEIDLLQHCLKIPENGFDDVQAQATHAAAYILWLHKQIKGINVEEKLEPDDLKTLLTKVCPEKTIVWDSFLGQSGSSSSISQS